MSGIHVTPIVRPIKRVAFIAFVILAVIITIGILK
jgi:hypothetical protein